MSDNMIIRGVGGTMFSGPEAVRLFQAMALRTGLQLYSRTGMLPSRGYTPGKMLAAAGAFTGKKYGRGTMPNCKAAADDLTIWIDATKAMMPVVDEAQG